METNLFAKQSLQLYRAALTQTLDAALTAQNQSQKRIESLLDQAPGIPAEGKRAINEWIEACRGGPKPLSSFDYSGPFTEMVLLGNLAVRLGKKIEWDAAALKAKNAPEADELIRRQYRPGWNLPEPPGGGT